MANFADMDSGSNIRFKVQISSSIKEMPVNSEFFEGIENIERFKVSGIYKYTVGNESNYKNIKIYCEEIKAYFPDAFIIAFKNGKLITLREALNEINN